MTFRTEMAVLLHRLQSLCHKKPYKNFTELIYLVLSYSTVCDLWYWAVY